jgi:hypothetical protein
MYVFAELMSPSSYLTCKSPNPPQGGTKEEEEEEEDAGGMMVGKQ